MRVYCHACQWTLPGFASVEEAYQAFQTHWKDCPKKISYSRGTAGYADTYTIREE